MSAFLSILAPFLFYWLLIFIACLAVVEFGQTYLYDETTPGAAWKVAIGSAVLAAIVTWSQPVYTTMFTDQLGRTVILAVVAFLIFTLAFRFHPWHALPIGICTVLLVSGIATMAVESFANRNRPEATSLRTPSVPLRRTTGTVQSRVALPEPKPASK
jgi:hypothetical protein